MAHSRRRLRSMPWKKSPSGVRVFRNDGPAYSRRPRAPRTRSNARLPRRGRDQASPSGCSATRVRYSRLARPGPAVTGPPPITSARPRLLARPLIGARTPASSDGKTSAPSSCSPAWRLTTRLSRPGGRRPSESGSYAPRMIGLPRSWPCPGSAGGCQGSWLSRPITRFCARAAIRQREEACFHGARIPIGAGSRPPGHCPAACRPPVCAPAPGQVQRRDIGPGAGHRPQP